MRRVVGAIGRVFITSGVLILLFVAYQLWGTGIYTARQQSELEKQFNAALVSEGQEAPTTSSTSTTTTLPGTPPSSTTTSTTEPPPPPPPEGDAVAHIEIPKIGVDSIVVNGVTRDDLRTAVARRNEVAPSIELEASGGVTLETIREIALTGVDRISVGALTHSARALDVALDWQPPNST